jgi:hypothetical protein
MDQHYDGSGNSPYEFILNPDKPKKPVLKGLGGGNHFILTIVALVGGVLLLMIVATVLLNALGPKKISKQELTGLAQSQQELIRISHQGGTDAVRQTTRNLATTTEYTLLTQQKETLKLLAKNGAKIGGKELALKQNAQTDQKLASAKTTSTFDDTFTTVTEQQLTAYASMLKSLSAKAKTQTERDRLGGYYQQTQQLISQVPYTQSETVVP